MRFYTVTAINLLIASIALGAPLDSVHEECYQNGKCMSVEARTAPYPTPVPTTFAVTARGDAVATEAKPTPSTVIGTPENEDQVDDDDNEEEENEDEDDENSIQARSANKHKSTSHSKPKPKTPSKPKDSKPKDPNNKNPKKKDPKKEDPKKEDPKKTNKPKAHCTNKTHPGNAKQTPKPAGGKRDFDEEAAPIKTVSVNDN